MVKHIQKDTPGDGVTESDTDKNNNITEQKELKENVIVKVPLQKNYKKERDCNYTRLLYSPL